MHTPSPLFQRRRLVPCVGSSPRLCPRRRRRQRRCGSSALTHYPRLTSLPLSQLQLHYLPLSFNFLRWPPRPASAARASAAARAPLLAAALRGGVSRPCVGGSLGQLRPSATAALSGGVSSGMAKVGCGPRRRLPSAAPAAVAWRGLCSRASLTSSDFLSRSFSPSPPSSSVETQDDTLQLEA